MYNMDKYIGDYIVCTLANDYVQVVKAVELVMHPHMMFGDLVPHIRCDEGRHDRTFIPASMVSVEKTEQWLNASSSERQHLFKTWNVLRYSSHKSIFEDAEHL